MKKTKLDLNNPIFVLYVNVENVSRDHAEDIMIGYKHFFASYENITVWVISANQTRIECVYDGGYKTREKELTELIEAINRRIDILSKSKTFEDFKINIRDFRLENIIKNE